MNTTPMRVARAALMLLAMAFAAGATAQDDLPSRVGRLADLGGRVYLSTGERADDWIEALRNGTVTTGDNLWVSGDGRAEIDYGGGQFRLAADTNVHVARLDDRMIALFVAQGRVIVRVRTLDTGEAARIDTPNTQLALTRPGLYRVEVSEDRDRTTLVVREGEGTVAVSAGVQQVLPGQSATVLGDEPAHADVRAGYGVDGFDTWSADRDRRYERSRSATYVSRQMIGYADLDDYGRWETTAEYGAVWVPTVVDAGWAPYRHGRWSWVGSYGWTWVDDAPWGYAPFHYGRWVHYGGRWAWCPGGYVARPAWAPALVGWYGGAGWSAAVSYGAPVYGWVPLGWSEPYIPSWHGCSDRCWTRYNRPYAVNRAERPHAPPTRYVNWNAPGGVTAVAGATFTGRQPVHANLVNVPRNVIQHAPVLSSAPLVERPTSASIPGARPVVAAPAPAVSFRNRPVDVSPGAPAWGTTPGGRVAVPPSGGTLAAPSPAYRAPTAPSAVAPGAVRGTPAAPPRGWSRQPEAGVPTYAERPVASPALRSPPAQYGGVAAPPVASPPAGAYTPPMSVAPRAVAPGTPAVRTTPAPVSPPVTPAVRTTAPPAAPVTPAVRTTPAPVAPVAPPVRSAPPAAQGGHAAPPVVASPPPAPARSAPPAQRNGEKPSPNAQQR